MVRRSATVLGLLLLALGAVAACGGDEEVVVPVPADGEVQDLDSAQGRALIDQGEVLVVDVRSLEEYREGHLVGAQHIPVEDEELWAARTEALDPEQPVVVYCRTGRRSEIAGQLLVEAGFTQVYDLGGVTDWDPEELAVES